MTTEPIITGQWTRVRKLGLRDWLVETYGTHFDDDPPRWRPSVRYGTRREAIAFATMHERACSGTALH